MKAINNNTTDRDQELCEKIEVAVQGSPSLISLKVSVDINHHERRTRQFATWSRCSMTWPSAVTVDRHRVGHCSVYVPAVSPTVYVPAVSPTVYVPAVSPAVYVPAVSPAVYVPAVSPTVYVPAGTMSPTVYIPAVTPTVYVPAVSPTVYVPAMSPTVYVPAVTVSPTGVGQAGMTVRADPSPTCRRLAAGNGQVCCTAVAPSGSWCSRPWCR